MNRGLSQVAREGLGRVVLVGAGPGDPDLLTVRAARALGCANLVLYDALIDLRVLELCSQAQRFCVGKRARREGVTQTTISALMIRAARRGKCVVRLKSGDPFVLGRGAEEVLACGAAGIPVEVIPGISSAVAGPALAGIPVTHRGLASGFVVLTASPRRHYEHVLAGLPAAEITVVLLMALEERSRIASFARTLGWPNQLPAAIVVGAGTPGFWSWTGTLDTLDRVSIPAQKRDLPGLIVLGRVVSLAESMMQALAPAMTSRATTPEEGTRWLPTETGERAR